MKKKLLPYLALFVTVVIWAYSAIVSKEAYEEINPLMLFFLRFAIGSILVSPFIFIRRSDPDVPRSELPKLSLFAFLLTVLGAGGWVVGLYFTSVTHAAIISTAGPVLVIILERLILKRKESTLAYVGTAISLLGTGAIIMHPVLSGEISGVSDPSLVWLGDLLIFLSALGSALFTVLESKEKENYHPYQKIAFHFMFACIVALPAALYLHFSNPEWVLEAGSRAWGGVLYYGIGASAIAYVLYQWGTENTTPLESSLFFYVQPVISIVAALFILKEKPAPLEWIGIALVLVGVAIATLIPQKPQTAEIST
jgi:drug/metabolite transporter (DMT)-like permease